MTQSYEQEQGEIAVRIKKLRSELKKGNRELYTADMFLEIVRRYTNARELTQRMMTELIDRIVVHHAEKAGKETTQRVTIYYNCIGAFTVPEWKNIPEIEILIPTRKGVAIDYSPQQWAS